ncbi:MAG: transcription-repair coupling factor, partial [Burkholderiales bacterium]|nr:transcription-repair coupling factor [Burkholderiales bacterium]
FELYTQMLESAVKSLKAGKEPDLLRPVASVAEVNLHSPALLLPDYVADVHARLRFYKRLAASKTEDQINDIQEEIVDRYGPLNDAARTLILSHKIRLEATEIGIKRIDAAKEVGFITFTEDAPVDTSKLFKLLQSRRDIKMTAPTRMRLENVGETAENRAEAILGLIKELK